MHDMPTPFVLPSTFVADNTSKRLKNLLPGRSQASNETAPDHAGSEISQHSCLRLQRKLLNTRLKHTHTHTNYNNPCTCVRVNNSALHSRSTHHDILTLELEVGHEVGVCWNSVDTRLFAQVPHADRVIISSSSHMVAIGAEVDGQHTLQVAVQKHDAVARAEVPHTATGVQPTNGEGSNIQ